MGRGRAPCCQKVGLNKGSWTPTEDLRLMAYIQKYGHGNWRALPKKAGLLRCGKSCRLRWINYLRPDIKRGNFTKEEEENIIKLHGLLGNKWSKIASCLPGRTDNEIKNMWNTHMKKRFASKEPKSSTDKPNEPPNSPTSSSSISCGNQGEGISEGKHTPTRPEPYEECNTIDIDEDFSVEKIEIPIEPNLNLWDVELGEFFVPEGPHPSTGDHQESSCSSFFNTNEISRNFSKESFLIDVPDIPIDAELWKMKNDASEVGPNVEHDGHKDPTTLQEDSTREVEEKRWLAYLEKELDLWEAIDGDKESVVRDAVEQLGSWEACDGLVEGDIDPVSCYFQKRPSSPSPLDFFI